MKQSHLSKLTEEDVRLMRELHAWKMAEMKRLESIASVQAIADKFEVHKNTVEKLLRYETWAHVR